MTTFEEKIKWLVAEHARAILAAEKSEKEREDALERAEMIAAIRETLLMRAPAVMKCIYDKAEIRVPLDKDEPPIDTEVDDAIREDMEQTDGEVEPKEEAGPLDPGPHYGRRAPRGPAGPTCPICGKGCIKVRKTGRTICLDDECAGSKTSEKHDPHGPLRAKAGTLPKPIPDGVGDEEAEQADHGAVTKIGNGKREVVDGSNFAAIVDALQMRAPHFMTSVGITEVIIEEIRHGHAKGGVIPGGLDTTVAGLLRDQRNKRVHKVPGLEMRQNGKRFEYRLAKVEKKP